MSDAARVVAVVAALFGLAALAGVLWVYARGSAQDARIERLQGERDDYLSRLNFIEPRYAALEEQNKTLRTLTDPTSSLEKLGATVDLNTGKILSVLDQQRETLDEIKKRVHVPQSGGAG